MRKGMLAFSGPQRRLPFNPSLKPTEKEWKLTAIAIYLLCEQDECWIAGKKLRDLESTYLSNIRSYLLRHVESFYVQSGIGEIYALSPSWLEMLEKHDIPLTTEQYSDPVAWMEDTPLMKAVVRILDERLGALSFGDVV